VADLTDDLRLSQTPRTAASAKAVGQTRYFTGKACKRGHLSQRLASTGACLACQSEAVKSWRKANSERYTAWCERWNGENKARRRAYKSDWHLLHRAGELNRMQKWRAANPSAARAHEARRRCRLQNAPGQHTANDIENILQLQNMLCAGCSADISLAYQVDHILPLALGGSNDRKNLQILCPPCNRRKHAKHPDDWAREIGRAL